jgi:serine/threonine-protein kinase
MNRVMNGHIPSPRAANSSVSEAIERIVMKSLSFNKSERFATAAEVEQEILRVLEEMSAHNSNRELGRFVSKLFADSRAETKALIESQLSKLENLDADDPASLEPVRLPESIPPADAAIDASRTTTVAEGGRAKRRWIVVLAVLACGALLATFIGTRRTPATAARTPVVPATQPAAPPPLPEAPPAPAKITLEISATPSSAKLFLDGEELPSNPTGRSLIGDKSRHVLKATAPGFVDKSVDVVLGADQKVYITLERAPSLTGKHAGPAGVSTKQAPAKPDCSSPFYVDNNGIKRIKADCM